MRALVVTLAAPFVLFGSEPAPSLDAFGARVDPAGDCSFSTADGHLTISVPGSEKAHDFAAELSNMTAPLVVREASGDFTMEVRVDDVFDPGGESTQPGRCGYIGAGLIVFADDRNYASIQRASLQWVGREARAYTNFELRVNGELLRGGNTDDFAVDPTKPTWLRLERRGNKILGAMSHDGKTWVYGKPKELTDPAWNRKDLVVGMSAWSTSKHPFTPTFSEFSVAETEKTAPEKLPDSVQVADSDSDNSVESVAADVPSQPNATWEPPILPSAELNQPEIDDSSAGTPLALIMEGGPTIALAHPGRTFQMLDGIRAVIRGWAAGEGVVVTVNYRDASADGSPLRVLRLVPVDKSGSWQFEVPTWDSRHLRMTFRAIDGKARTSMPVTITAKRKARKE
jgi:regulation of enolase protein 1 (concanavalin A-like superfamily)